MTIKSIVPAFFLIDSPADEADILAGEVAMMFNASLRQPPPGDPVPRIRIFLCEASPTTELDIEDPDPHTLEGYTIDAGSDRSATGLIARIVAYGHANDTSQPTETLSAILQIANGWLQHRVVGAPNRINLATPTQLQDAATLLLHAAAEAAATGADPSPERLRAAFEQAQAEHPGTYSHLLNLYRQQKDHPA